jgi:hypothetical protein
MERRTHSDENGQASEAELAGLRGGLAQEVIASLLGEAVDKMTRLVIPTLAISACARDLCPQARQTLQSHR